MTWRSDTADRLLDSLRVGLPQTAAIADDDGPAVLRSDNRPAAGRFEIGPLTRTMTGAVLASVAEVELRTSPVGPRGVDHDYFTVGF